MSFVNMEMFTGCRSGVTLTCLEVDAKRCYQLSHVYTYTHTPCYNWFNWYNLTVVRST